MMRWEVQPDFALLDAAMLTQDSGDRNHQRSGGKPSTSSYVSPLIAIHQSIRRQNPIAAAAALMPSGPSQFIMNDDCGPDDFPSSDDMFDSTDPWENLATMSPSRSQKYTIKTPTEENMNSEGISDETSVEECSCRYIGRRSSFKGGTSDICAHCGKRRTPSSSELRRHRSVSVPQQLQNQLSQLQREAMRQDPQHAQALLQSTPQLRFICPASTDMQAAGHLGDMNLLQRSIVPLVKLIDSGGQADRSSTARSQTSSLMPGLSEYKASLVRDRANHQAASELASLMWVLAHEMSQEDFFTVESQVFTEVFGLVHSSDKQLRMAGLAALDALLAAPSADEEKKSIKCANTLSAGLRAANGDFEYLSAVSRALGHMATRTANVDLVECEVARALEWLGSERSDRRLAACLSLKQFAVNAPTTFHSKTSQSTLGQGGSNEFLDQIFQAIRDPQPIVRACAADALSQCLKIIVERRHLSMTGLLCQVYFALIEGLDQDLTRKKRPRLAVMTAEASQHGSLLVVSTMLACTGDFMLPRFEEVCRAVLAFRNHTKALIRLEVIRLLPRLANTNPKVFGRRFLEDGLTFLIESASSPTAPRVGVDVRPSAYKAIGQLILAMMDEETGQVIGSLNAPTIKMTSDPNGPVSGSIVELKAQGIVYEKLGDIFNLVKAGLKFAQDTPLGSPTTKKNDTTRTSLSPVLHCAANLVAALGDLAKPYVPDLIDDMFRAGLSNDLIHCLQSIAQCVPDQQDVIEDRMLQEVSMCLAGLRDVYDPLSSTITSGANIPITCQDSKGSRGDGTGTEKIRIEMSSEATAVNSLVLSLQTLASFGGTIRKTKASGSIVPLLPFVQKVASRYLAHPSSEVRRAAALTCCALLLPYEIAWESRLGGHTGVIVDDVLSSLLRVAVSDPSGSVRICVVQALDSRYDSFLCQRHHLSELFLLLQDEMLATRAAGLRLLGRVASINPAPILPVMRRFLTDSIVEMQCGTYNGRGREEATRLCVVFLKAKPLQRLVEPVLPSLIDALPFHGAAPPRLVAASLEALGELALASGVALKPWIKDLVPRVLEIMGDQSSASKQRTSLRTLGQIASATGYVIKPYLDHPGLLLQATDMLPATKRAPWSLRREVIRTLGIFGALDPDMQLAAASKARKGGAVGGAYFEEADFHEPGQVERDDPVEYGSGNAHTDVNSRNSTGTMGSPVGNDENLPAYLVMHEQYAMFAQPMSELTPAKRISPADEDFYSTVAVQALMRIFRDPNLSVHHSMVIQAVMFIFKSMGLGCVAYLKKVVPHMLSSIRTGVSTSLRESILKQLARLSLIVREHLRPYVSDIFDVAESLWSSRHLATIFNLISNIAVGVPDAFHKFIPRLIRRLLSTFDDLQVADWTENERRNPLNRGRDGIERLHLLLYSLSSLKGVLGDYLHILVPALLKLADALASLGMNLDVGIPEDTLSELSMMTFRSISILIESKNAANNRVPSVYQNQSQFDSRFRESSEKGLPSRVVQPIARLLREKPTRNISVCSAMVETLCVCARLIGVVTWSQLYDEEVRRALFEWQTGYRIGALNLTTFTLDVVGDEYLQCLQLYKEFLEDLRDANSTSTDTEHTVKFATRIALKPSTLYIANIDDTPEAYEQQMVLSTTTGATKHKVNQRNLQRAWDVSQRSSRDDWDEWMRRFSIQLLREAPAPALRSAASLAQAYQPLARELFSAAFACCWNELSNPFKANLVHALKTVFVADVSPEILQALLNLAEFMEYDSSGGLPIEIPVLADLSLKCRAYGKALHYNEREYSQGGGTSCVEALISINRKLDLQEAALGILKASGPLEKDLSTRFSRHQARDMFYSVIWSTTERHQSRIEAVDVAAKEEFWLARLGSWTDALAVYENKLKRNPDDPEAILGCMRCLGAVGEWRKVLDLAHENWDIMSGDFSKVGGGTSSGQRNPRSKRKALRICAQSAWRLGQWDNLEKFATQLVGSPNQTQTQPNYSSVDFDGAFYSAVLHVHRKEWGPAAEAIDGARKAMDSRLTALMAESYSRAYPSMVTAQTLAEMEEIIEFRKLEEHAVAGHNQHPANRPDADRARKRLLSVWRDRLAGCRMDADVHASVLAVRSLVVKPEEEVDATLTLSELSRQAQQFKFAERVLLDSLGALKSDLDGPVFGMGLPKSLRVANDFSSFPALALPNIVDSVLAGDFRNIAANYGSAHEQWSRKLVAEAGGLQRLDIQHRLYFAYIKHLWYTERKDEAMTRLSYFCDVLEMISRCEQVADSSLRVASWLELGEWKLLQAAPPTLLSAPLQLETLTIFRRATMLQDCGYKAWHAWALLNLRIVLEQRERESAEKLPGTHAGRNVRNHVVAAVKGFVNAITLGTKKWSASVQQDLLNVLTCLFQYGKLQDVATVINESIGSVAIEAWLGVLPQLLARIHIVDPSIRTVLHPLLIKLGEKHPQALMYPLSVLLNSPVAERKASAESLMHSVKAHASALVEEAQMVSSELIRVAILWLEMWHEGLEDASRLYFGEGNVTGMLDLLFPLHEMLEKGAETRKEIEYLTNFGQDLSKAFAYIKEYSRLVSMDGDDLSGRPGSNVRVSDEAETAMNRAWDIYYIVFRKINKQLPSLTKLELNQCSPSLSNARNLELSVPGTYRIDGSYIKIDRVHSEVEVITSKQRPRKITMRGSDGKNYLFLLKGHEDLRQDERVMQLFGLVNALLVRDLQTKKYDLKIQRYAISALSHNCGVVGWVPHSDTLHSLIRDYRLSKKLPLNMENREMIRIAPDYDLLTVMQKVEVFSEALRKTPGGGNDLGEISWLKSTNSEEWLDRRTKFTRSLAVMSMVGYILGLGDRHPSNLMLDKVSGRILHIDFGDCFEVAMNREKFPEKVPFRLTRMLIKAMEVSGVEGSYRSTCERTMSVLRDSRDSLVTMLEAFVYDPLISWRLVDLSNSGSSHKPSTHHTGADVGRMSLSDGVPIDMIRAGRPRVQSIRELADEDSDDEGRYGAYQQARGNLDTNQYQDQYGNEQVPGRSRARSMQMYANIQNWAASLTTDARIASIAAERSEQLPVEGSIARSRIERSMKQRELLSLLRENDGVALEEALNEKALKVIRRVQDKLTGTDFPDCEGEPLDVTDQVQRLIVQATSCENLCQLFIGWCSFW